MRDEESDVRDQDDAQEKGDSERFESGRGDSERSGQESGGRGGRTDSSDFLTRGDASDDDQDDS